MVALLGPNGAGKSTLLRVIVGLHKRFAGDLDVLGLRRGPAHNTRQLAPKVGYLGQSPEYDPAMSVSNHVAYCGWLKGMSGTHLEAESHDAIERVGLVEDSATPMKHLSGGMRRRAAIAGVLVSSPELLVLDEPTAGLDPAQRAGFKQLIASLASTTSVIMSTHLVEDVAHLCDHVMVLVDGQFVFAGRTRDFGADGAYRSDSERLELAYLRATSAVRQG